MKKEDTRNWYLIDAKDKVLGRISTEIAKILQGKNMTNYEPYSDMGGSVIIINAKYIKLTGKKAENKIYKHHTGYLGNLKEITYKELIQKKPEEIIKKAVWNMLPKNRLRNKRILRLKIYPESIHPHTEKKLIEIM